MGKNVFILNPRSAGGETRRRFERHRAMAEKIVGDVSVKLTQHPMHAATLTRESIAEGAKSVIAVGGDGTLNEVVNGFFDEKGERLKGETSLGFVTSGTGGDFRRSLDAERDFKKDFERLARRRLQSIDVGRAEFVDANNEPLHRFFLNIASVGFSADVVNKVNASSKRLGAKASFMGGTARSLMKNKGAHVRLFLGDEPAREKHIHYVAVANGSFFGGGMHVAPNASIDDGFFDVIEAAYRPATHWLTKGLAIFKGTHLEDDAYEESKAQKVRFEPTRGKVLIELDGEQPGQLPATFTIVKKTIELLS